MLDAIIYSPIGRAKHTAQIIRDVCAKASPEHKIAFEQENNLIELDARIFENKNIETIQKENPALYAQFVQHSWQAAEGAERISSLSLISRAGRV